MCTYVRKDSKLSPAAGNTPGPQGMVTVVFDSVRVSRGSNGSTTWITFYFKIKKIHKFFPPMRHTSLLDDYCVELYCLFHVYNFPKNTPESVASC